MTDITEQDRREARKWAEQTIANRVNSPTDPWVIAARLFLANEEPPAPTLAEELREWAKKRYSGVVGTGKHELLNLATRAEQIEQDRDEARAAAKTWQEQDENDCEMYSEEVAGLLATLAETREALAVEGRRVEKRAAERDEARAEVERLTAATIAQEENVAPDQQANSLKTPNSSFPDPADVPSGEPWIVDVDGEQRTAVRGATYHRPWNTFKESGSVTFAKDHEITLVSRFVPAPRVITNPDELDKLGDESIVKPDGHSWLYAQYGLWHGKYRAYTSDGIIEHFGPVTVLWEAGE